MCAATGKRFKTNNNIDTGRNTNNTTGYNPQARFEMNEANNPYSHSQVNYVPKTTSQDTPRPIGVDPQATGSFSKLDAGQGAVIQDRQNAGNTGSFEPIDMHRMNRNARPQVSSHHQAPAKKKLYTGIALAVIVVTCAVFAFVQHINVIDTPSQVDFEERTEATTDKSVEFDGNKFMLDKGEDGAYLLVSQPLEGQTTQLSQHFKLEGTPVSLVLFDGSFIIAENLSDGTWDVISYMVSDGSVASKLVDGDGKPVGGTGKVISSTLDGENIKLELEDGQVVETSLV